MTRPDLEPIGGDLGAGCLDALFRCHSQADVCRTLISNLLVVSSIPIEFRESVIAGFAVQIAPVLEAGVEAIREGK